MKLLKRDKNTLLQRIIDKGFNPVNFEFLEAGPTSMVREGTTRINFKPSREYYFEISESVFFGSNIKYCPGHYDYVSDYTIENNHNGKSKMTFLNVNENFNYWLDSLIKENEQEDLWEKLKAQREILTDDLFEKNADDKFNESEKVLLIKMLDNFSSEIKSNPGLKIVAELLSDNVIGFLKDKLNTDTKSQWKFYFLGAITSVAINMTVTPEQGTMLWEIIKRTFSALVLN